MLNSVLNIEKQGTDHIGREIVTASVEVTGLERCVRN
jgi:hypothetical protein